MKCLRIKKINVITINESGRTEDVNECVGKRKMSETKLKSKGYKMFSIGNEVWWSDERRNGIAVIEPKHPQMKCYM
jgi:hypothetical protein